MDQIKSENVGTYNVTLMLYGDWEKNREFRNYEIQVSKIKPDGDLEDGYEWTEDGYSTLHDANIVFTDAKYWCKYKDIVADKLRHELSNVERNHYSGATLKRLNKLLDGKYDDRPDTV